MVNSQSSLRFARGFLFAKRNTSMRIGLSKTLNCRKSYALLTSIQFIKKNSRQNKYMFYATLIYFKPHPYMYIYKQSLTHSSNLRSYLRQKAGNFSHSTYEYIYVFFFATESNFQIKTVVVQNWNTAGFCPARQRHTLLYCVYPNGISTTQALQ